MNVVNIYVNILLKDAVQMTDQHTGILLILYIHSKQPAYLHVYSMHR